MRVARGTLVALLVLECAGIVWLVLSPTAQTASGAVHVVSISLRDLGFPQPVYDPGFIEFALNVLLFAPLAALCALIWTRPKLWMWILGGFLLSSTLEWVQDTSLLDRSPSSSDIIANTLGTALGAGVVCATRWLHQVWLEDLSVAGRGS